MATLNKAMFMGRLVYDPREPRTIGTTGTTVISFRIAVGRSKKNQETGQWEPDPNLVFIDCEVFSGRDGNRRLIDVVQNYLRKGGEVYVEGRVQLNEWDKDGEKRATIRLTVSELQLLGGRPEGGSGGGGGDHEEDAPQQQAPPRRAPVTQTPRANTNGPARKQPVYNEPEPDNGGNEEDIPF